MRFLHYLAIGLWRHRHFTSNVLLSRVIMWKFWLLRYTAWRCLHSRWLIILHQRVVIQEILVVAMVSRGWRWNYELFLCCIVALHWNCSSWRSQTLLNLLRILHCDFLLLVLNRAFCGVHCVHVFNGLWCFHLSSWLVVCITNLFRNARTWDLRSVKAFDLGT